jgi:hypothetical protein
VVDRGLNRKVSKNHLGGVKVSRIECGRSWAILLTFTPPM